MSNEIKVHKMVGGLMNYRIICMTTQPLHVPHVTRLNAEVTCKKCLDKIEIARQRRALRASN